MTDVLSVFNESIAICENEYRKCQRVFSWLSYLRVALVLAALVLFVFFANARDIQSIVLLLVLFPLLFGWLVSRHNKVKYRRDQAGFMIKINKDEIDRFHHKLDHVATGQQYMDTNHPYSADLDIFGQHSLFSLLNRTTTAAGSDRLAEWLTKRAERDTIVRRQEAVAELKALKDWRHRFQATGMHFQNQQSNINILNTWLAEKGQKQSVLLMLASFILPMVTLFALGAWLLGMAAAWMPGILLAVNIALVAKSNKSVHHTMESTYEGTKALKAYYQLIGQIENTDFQARDLKRITTYFNSESFKASRALRKLYFLLDYLNARANAFYHVLNMVFLLDFHLTRALEKWKTQNGEKVAHWFSLLGEMEAYNSLAGYAFNRQEASFPEISEESYVLRCKNMGHPLLPGHSRVNNDFELQGKGRVMIVTGSNMSGKSTFQRTVGVNCVLAFLGAPVCADAMTVSVMQVFTSMRVSDKLEENVSSFYAELKRIRALLDLTQSSGVPVLYMLDEVLKGTNSHDRHTGAMALVKQLSRENAMGLVSTHDLELGELSKELATVTNGSFNSSMEGEKLVFNYKLHEGICQSFNASQLMKQMGIKIDE